MISRWEDVARKTAQELGMPEEAVLESIRFYAKKTQEIASKPRVMEMDLLGIGSIQSNYPRLKKAVYNREYKLKLQRMYVKNYESKGNQTAAERCKLTIASLEEDLATFKAFLDIKQEFWKGEVTRTSIEKEYLEKHGGYIKRNAKREREKREARGEKRQVRRKKGDHVGFDGPLPFPDPE